MIKTLRDRKFAAVIADDTILVPEAHQAAGCALHILPDQIAQYDLAIAYRRTFDNAPLMEAIDEQIAFLLGDSTLFVRSPLDD
jgi:hypothetical protein